MRIFGSERMDGMLQKLGLKEDEAIIHPWINKALEKAQKKVEARNFDIRKNLLKYDDVQNDQRKVVFEQRIELMEGEHLAETVAEMRQDVIDDLVAKHIPENAYAEQWDAAGLKEGVRTNLNLDLPVDEWVKEEGIAEDEIRERLTAGRQRRRRRARRALRPRRHDLCRALGDAADARPSVARASGQSRPSALGRRLPRLCAARSAERVQGRGLRAVPGDAGQSAPGRDRAADARRTGARGRRSAAAAGAGDATATTSTARPARTISPMAISAAPRSPSSPTTGPWRRRNATRTTRRPGARSAATRPAPAAQARNTSTATARLREARLESHDQ